MALATLLPTCQVQSRIAGDHVASRSGAPSILLHGKIQQALLLYNLHGFFDYGLGRDGDSIMDHEAFRLQLGEFLTGFQGDYYAPDTRPRQVWAHPCRCALARWRQGQSGPRQARLELVVSEICPGGYGSGRVGARSGKPRKGLWAD